MIRILLSLALAVSAVHAQQLAFVQVGEHKAAADGFLAKLKSPATKAVTNAQTAALSADGLAIDPTFACETVPGLVRIRTNPSVRTAAFAQGSDLIRQAKDLMETGLYEYVEPDWIVTTCQTPSDTAYLNGSLWGIRNTGASGGTAGIDVNATPAWAITPGSRDIIVGVIDTGVRYTHQDLKNNMWVNPGEIPANGIDDDRNGYIDDIHGMNGINNSGNPMDDNNHGTHCAGTIAATANDVGQIVGVAYNVRIMALKFLSAGGSGAVSNAVKCVDYATRMGAQITSNSWGGGAFSQALFDAIRAANTANSLFIAAAGNSNANNDTSPAYPANYNSPNVVSVAAIDSSGNRASFSSYGATTVHVGAPGVAVLSSTATSDSAYASYSGTSMACPHASGVAALILSNNRALTPVQIRQRLVETSRPLASLNGRTVANGIVDAHKALLAGADGVLDLTLNSTTPSVKAGKAAIFTVAVTDGAPISSASVTGSLGGENPVSFRDDGVAPDATPGDAVHTASLQVPAGATGTISFSASASAPGKSAGSATRVFTVIPPPANDSFENRTVLAMGSTSTNGTNRNASKQLDEPSGNLPNAGGQTVWWEWNAGTTGTATISTAGSSFDTTLAVYSGYGGLDSLGLIASNDDSSSISSSVSFEANAGGVYYIQVDGNRGAEGNIRLNYPAPGQASGPPFITTHPESQLLVEEDSLTLSISAGGTIPISFQWFRNEMPINGATGPRLILPSVTLADAGNYTVRVSNPFGQATSNPALVQIDPVSVRPANDKFQNAQILQGSSGRVAAVNLRASAESGEPNHASNSTPLESVWFRWTAPASGTATFNTYGSSFDTTLAAYTGQTVATLQLIDANDDSDSVQSFISFAAVAGVTYYIAVDGTASNEGTILLGYNLQPTSPGLPNDAFASRSVLGGASASANGTNTGATGESGEPQHTPTSAPAHSVWWAWTAPATGVAVIDTLGSDFDTALAIYTGSNINSLQTIASNDDFAGPQSLVSFNCTVGTTYQIAVDGASDATGSILLQIASGSTAPEISVQQPAGSELSDGGSSVDFGTTLNTRESLRTFTIRNTGASRLTGLRLSIDNNVQGEFFVVSQPSAPLLPGGNTTFTIKFVPAAEGIRAATLRILSNDADESPFDILLTGSGLIVPPDRELRVTSLSAASSALVDITAQTGDDRCGIAAGNGTLLVNGDTSATRLQSSPLANSTAFGRRIDGLLTDLATGKFYTLAQNGIPFSEGGTSANQLLEIDPATGLATGSPIALTSSLPLANNSGLFSGNGRAVLHNGTRAFDIRIPSGIVIDLGTMTRPAWQPSESWAVHGVAEYFANALHIAYRAAGANLIARSTIPSGATSTVATFSNLGDLANWTIDIPTGRWFFTHEGASQFGGSGSANEYAGSAGATFLVLPPPSFANLGAIEAYAKQEITFLLSASPEVESYAASGLPPGLTLNSTTGLISGKVEEAGTTMATVSATNRAATSTAPLRISIKPMLSTFSEDFDPAPEPSLWEQLSGQPRANRNGQVAGPGSTGNSLWFGGSGARHATTLPLDLRGGGKISFTLATANGKSGIWEKVDDKEEIFVDFSLDGTTFETIGGPFTSDTWKSFEVDLPSAAEGYGVRLRFRQANHSGRGLDHFAIDNVRIGSNAALAPEIAVEQPAGTNLVDGVSAVVFEGVSPSGESLRTFTIRNLGLTDLDLGGISLAGLHTGDFQPGEPSVQRIPPGSFATLQVRFAPLGFGSRFASLRIANNDSNENPFDIVLRGTGIDPLGFFDGFDPSHSPTLWEQFGGRVAANTRAQAAGPGSTGKSLHFDGTGLRHATTRPLDTRSGARIRVLIATGNNAPLWDSPEFGEEVVLEASADGSPFVVIGGPWLSKTWLATETRLPTELRSPATRLRVRQSAHSGTGLDHFAIEDFTIESEAP
jgi:subtilisin family serine protease